MFYYSYVSFVLMFQAKFMPITVLEVLQHCHLTLSMHKINQGLYVQNPRCLNSHLKPLLKLCSSMLAVYIYDNPKMLIPYIIYSGNSTKYDISEYVLCGWSWLWSWLDSLRPVSQWKESGLAVSSSSSCLTWAFLLMADDWAGDRRDERGRL